MAELDRQDLDTLIELAIDAGLAEPVRRLYLLTEIPHRLVARLPTSNTPLEQMRSDIHALYHLRMDDGRTGLAHWLDAGLALIETLAIRESLEAFVERVKVPPADARDHLDDIAGDARPLEEHLTTISADVEGAPISQLFNAEAAIVPFDPEVQPGPWQTLTEWCDGARTVESVVLTGPGGTGKSRMARELPEPGREVRPILAIENAPADAHVWSAACKSAGVVLSWGPDFAGVVIG